MKEKIQFIKWLWKDVNYWWILLIIQAIGSDVLLFTLPGPYDLYIAYYMFSFYVLAALYFFIIHPIRKSYKAFLEDTK